MTRERALELAAEYLLPQNDFRELTAAAILEAIAEERQIWRKSAYREADEAQVLQMGRESSASV